MSFHIFLKSSFVFKLQVNTENCARRNWDIKMMKLLGDNEFEWDRGQRCTRMNTVVSHDDYEIEMDYRMASIDDDKIVFFLFLILFSLTLSSANLIIKLKRYGFFPTAMTTTMTWEWLSRFLQFFASSCFNLFFLYLLFLPIGTSHHYSRLWFIMMNEIRGFFWKKFKLILKKKTH